MRGETRVYLDHNATSPISETVRDAMSVWLDEPLCNPSSVHRSGRRARSQVEEVRRKLASELGVEARELTFTSGATEAIHLAVRSFIKAGDHVVCSAMEHGAVLAALEANGAQVSIVSPDERGRFEPSTFAQACSESTRLVVLMGAQNELGNVYPVAEVAQRVSPIPVFCDAVQVFGKVKLNIPSLCVAALSISGHKIGGPPGVGALWLRSGIEGQPLLPGGSQERGRRAGTENTLGIVGLGAAVTEIPNRIAKYQAVRGQVERLESALVAGIDGLHIQGDRQNRLPNTVSFRIEGVSGELLVQALDLEGVEVSSGAACASGGLEPSPTLLALGLSPEDARGGLRVSLGPDTTPRDIEFFLNALTSVVRRVRGA